MEKEKTIDEKILQIYETVKYDYCEERIHLWHEHAHLKDKQAKILKDAETGFIRDVKELIEQELKVEQERVKSTLEALERPHCFNHTPYRGACSDCGSYTKLR